MPDTKQKTSEREVLSVFVTYKKVRTNLLGQDQIVPATGSRGEKVDLFEDDEKRLDALGALVPKDSQVGADALVAAAVARALNPYDVPVQPALVQPSVSPPSLGAEPVGTFVVPDAGDAADGDEGEVRQTSRSRKS